LNDYWQWYQWSFNSDLLCRLLASIKSSKIFSHILKMGGPVKPSQQTLSSFVLPKVSCNWEIMRDPEHLLFVWLWQN
jgi:hypothetical protein